MIVYLVAPWIFVCHQIRNTKNSGWSIVKRLYPLLLSPLFSSFPPSPPPLQLHSPLPLLLPSPPSLFNSSPFHPSCSSYPDHLLNPFLSLPVFLCRFGHQDSVSSIDCLSRERPVTAGMSDRTVRMWKVVEESQLVFHGHKWAMWVGGGSVGVWVGVGGMCV